MTSYEVTAEIRFTVHVDGGMSAAAQETVRRLDAVRADPERPMLVTDVHISCVSGAPSSYDQSRALLDAVLKDHATGSIDSQEAVTRLIDGGFTREAAETFVRESTQTHA